MTNHDLFVTTVTGDANAPKREGVAVSSTTTYYSKLISGQEGDGFALHLFWTGTPTGTLTLWYSDVENPILTSDNDWVQDSTWSPTNPAGSAAKFRSDANGSHARWKRVKYVNASGSGVLYGRATSRQF